MIEVDAGDLQLLFVVWLAPAAGVLLLLIVTRRAPERVRLWARVAAWLAIGACLAGAVALTQWPFVVDLSLRRVAQGNWTPLEGSIGLHLRGHPSDAIGNAVMILPLGLLTPFATRRWRGIVPAVVIVVLVAFGLEGVQGLAIDRTFDIDDAIAGSIGGVAGALFALVLRWSVLAEPSRRSPGGARRLSRARG